MPITYNAGTNTLTFEYVVGDPIGDSMLNPYTMESLYNASVAGGWGVISKTNNMYDITCKIVGTGIALTYFKSQYEVWYWDTNTGNDSIIIQEIYLYDVKIIKNTYGGTLYLAAKGSVILCSIENYQLVYIYGVSSSSPLNFERITLQRIQSHYFPSNINISKVQIYNSNYGIARADFITNSNIICINNTISAIYTYQFNDGYAYAFRNLNTISCARAFTFRTIITQPDRNLYFIDCNLDWDLYGYASCQTGKDTIHALSTFIYHLGDGVHLLLKDQFGNTVLDKNINNDDTDEVEFHRHIFEYLTGTGVIQDVLIDYFPFTAYISKTGFKTLEIPNITINGGNETILTGELEYPELYVSAVDITDCTEIGADDGQLVITATGGDGTYQYSLDGVTYQASDTFTDLAPDDYTVYVRDGEGTIATFDVTISEPIPEDYAELVLSADLSEDILSCDLTEDILTCELN